MYNLCITLHYFGALPGLWITLWITLRGRGGEVVVVALGVATQVCKRVILAL